MARLKVFIKGEDSFVIGNKRYSNEVNANNYREIALILKDLRNLDLPIDKAIKEYKLSKSDWNEALGL